MTDDVTPDPYDDLTDAARWHLNLALDARQGRDRWRMVGPILRQLRDEGVPWKLITEWTGIPQATGYRMIGRSRLSPSSTSASTPSAAGS